MNWVIAILVAIFVILGGAALIRSLDRGDYHGAFIVSVSFVAVGLCVWLS